MTDPAADRAKSTWVGMAAIAWVLDEAPTPAGLVATHVAIARRAGEDGRGSYQSNSTIGKKVGKSADQVHRDIRRLLGLGLLVLGDQSLVADLPVWKRPVVYDLPMNVKGPKPAKESRNKTGKAKTPLASMPPPPLASMPPPPLASMPPKEALEEALEESLEESSSSARSSARSREMQRLIDLGFDEDEASLTLKKIKTENRIDKTLGAYLRGIPDSDLLGYLAEIRNPAESPMDDIEADRRVFAQGLLDEPRCRHHVAGGHIVHPPTGWVKCEHERKRRELAGEYTPSRPADTYSGPYRDGQRDYTVGAL